MSLLDNFRDKLVLEGSGELFRKHFQNFQYYLRPIKHENWKTTLELLTYFRKKLNGLSIKPNI